MPNFESTKRRTLRRDGARPSFNPTTFKPIVRKFKNVTLFDSGDICTIPSRKENERNGPRTSGFPTVKEKTGWPVVAAMSNLKGDFEALE